MNRETATPSVQSMPGERARKHAATHREFAATSTYVYDFVWDRTEEAAGPFCTDVDGNVLMDFTSHVGAAPLGYNNPKITDRLVEFELVDPMKIAGQDFYVDGEDGLPGPTELMERLTEISGQYGMDTVFLSNSGAEAVENAIKIAYDHTHGQYGITCEGAFHGRTLGALSLNRSKGVHRREYPAIADIHDIPFCARDSCDPPACECGFFTNGGKSSSQLREMLDPERGYVDPASVAYLIIEPVQGEGGYRIPTEAFMHEIEDCCEEHDLVLVADEIQSGLGRTGTMWAADQFPIEPDVITSAKGLRIGATISRQELFPEEKARLSSTWGAGDILSSALGHFTIDAIEEYDLLTNASERGRQALELLEDGTRYEGWVTDVRGLGLMLAVEFNTKAQRDAVIDAALKRGLLTLGCGHKTLRLLPPLDVTEREISMGCDLLCEAITASGES